MLADPSEEIQAARARKMQIANDQVRQWVITSILKFTAALHIITRLPGGSYDTHYTLEVARRKCATKKEHVAFIVLNQQNDLRLFHPLPG